jgi:putative transposase
MRLQAIAVADNPELLAEYRERLGSLSWLMRGINEPIAKKSNQEDFVKGHFYECSPLHSPFGPSSFLRCSNSFQTNLWESRFTSQALLDETAALTCMAYVDLNPIRAGLATELEASEHTSIQKRLIAMTDEQLNEAITAVAGKVRQRTMTMPLKDYIELVEWVVFCVLQKLHTLHPCK